MYLQTKHIPLVVSMPPPPLASIIGNQLLGIGNGTLSFGRGELELGLESIPIVRPQPYLYPLLLKFYNFGGHLSNFFDGHLKI